MIIWKNFIKIDLREYNKLHSDVSPIQHVNTTFEKLANAINEVIDERDYDMQEVLDDYLQYCYNDKLIPDADAYKIMRMQLATTTIKFNVEHNVYYDKEERGFRPHEYLGLYTQKSVRAIGKICARIITEKQDNEIVFKKEFGEITEERKNTIMTAIKDSANYGYDLTVVPHRYFFVEKFYETDFKKVTPNGAMGTRIFNLADILGTDKMPETEKIAELLKEKTWE